MNVRGFHHLAIQVRDLERQATFYREVFGMTELVRYHRDDGTVRSIWLGMPDGGFLALEQVSGEMAEEGFQHDRPGLFLLALRIPASERAAALEELAARGLPVMRQTQWTVFLRDPEGNRIGLSHHPDDPA